MSQPAAPRTIKRSTQPGPAVPNPASGLALGRAPQETRRSAANRLLHGTPGRMRLLGLVGALAALIVGVLLAAGVRSSSSAAERAAANTEQTLRITNIHTELLKADALATNAFLIAGAEPADRRLAYDKAVGQAVGTIAEAASAQPADRDALVALSDAVQTYTSYVDQARSNNRLGLPVGAAYMTLASNELRSEALPILTTLTKANEVRARGEFNHVPSQWSIIPALVGIGVIVLISVWLARRTRRYINRPIAAAVALLAVAAAFVYSTVTTDTQSTSRVLSTSYDEAITNSQLAIAAHDARANESLTLIARGSGAAYEKAFDARSSEITQQASAATRTSWAAYVAQHDQARKLDDAGDWDKAVALVTQDGALRTAFDQALAPIEASATESEEQTSSSLAAAADGWVAPFLFSLAAAIAAALLVVRGMGQRIGEYR